MSVPRHRLTLGRAYPVPLHYYSRNEQSARTGLGRASRTPGPQPDYNIKNVISAASSSPTEVSGLASPGRRWKSGATVGDVGRLRDPTDASSGELDLEFELVDQFEELLGELFLYGLALKMLHGCAGRECSDDGPVLSGDRGS